MRRNFVRVATALLVSALIATGCGGGDDDDDTTGPDDTEAPSDTTGGGQEGELPEIEVDRSSRFARADTFCEPATEEETETPEATDDGITADSVAITHIRVTLEDLEDLGFAIPIGNPADQAEKFVGIINDRCGGIHGRELDLSLVETPPLAPPGEDMSAITQAACIEATEDNHAVFAYSGSGFGGGGGASCITEAGTIYLTTYNITQDDIENAGNRLYSNAISSVDGLAYLVRILDEEGAFDGKTIGVVMQDTPGEPDIVQRGLIDTLEELGHEVKRADIVACAGGNLCSQGMPESVQGMIADGVDVLFPLLNVINLPTYIGEMVTQGVQPGDIQMYQSGYQAQSGDLVSSKVIDFSGEEAGRLYNGTVIIDAGNTGAYREPGFEPSEYGEMCNREYQEAGGEKYSPSDPATLSAYGATTGTCSFIRIIARALDAAGPNPTREDIAAAVEGLGGLDAAGDYPGSFGPGKYTAPNVLYKVVFHYPCPDPEDAFGDSGACILPEEGPYPLPTKNS
jgi:hypothetical protein